MGALLFDLLHRMQDRGVVLAAKLASDLRQGRFREMLGQVHGNLPGIDDGARIILCLDFDQPQSELLGNGLLNRFDRDFPRLLINEILEDLLGVRKCDLGANE